MHSRMVLGKGTFGDIWQRFGGVQCALRDKLAWACDVWKKPSDSCMKWQRAVRRENVCYHQGSTAGDAVLVFTVCTGQKSIKGFSLLVLGI